MPRSIQETILAAYIAASGKCSPFDAAHDAAEFCSLAHSLHRLFEAACNTGLTERQEKRVQKPEQKVRSVIEGAGLTLKHFKADPRRHHAV